MDTRVLVNQSKMARDQIQLALKRVLKADPEQRTLLRNIEQSEGMLALLGYQPVKPLLGKAVDNNKNSWIKDLILSSSNLELKHKL